MNMLQANKMFRNGQFAPAFRAYGDAMKVYDPRVVYLNNSTAVALKLGK